MKSTKGLQKDRDFRKVYRHRNSMANRLLIIYIRENQQAYNRVGFTVSKKVGKATVRNRVKRRMKESYRKNHHQIKIGYDVVFIARDTAANSSMAEIESAMMHLLRKKKMIVKKEVQ